MTPEEVHKKSYDAKSKFPNSFVNWLGEFLHFAPKELLQTDLKRFEECMSTKEGYLKYKSLGYYLHKYAATNYIFYYKSDDSPEKMTNALQVSQDSDQWVEFFNLDYFDLGESRIVLYSFVEALNLACIDSDVDFNELYKKLMHLYFTINDFDTDIQAGPPKSRFVEYYRQKTGESIAKNPDQTLIISKSFLDTFDPEKRQKLSEILLKDEPPTQEDYVELVKILNLKEKKGKRVWTDDTFSVYRSNDRKYFYLVREEDGKVWRVYNEKTSLREILSDYNTIIG